MFHVLDNALIIRPPPPVASGSNFGSVCQILNKDVPMGLTKPFWHSPFFPDGHIGSSWGGSVVRNQVSEWSDPGPRRMFAEK